MLKMMVVLVKMSDRLLLLLSGIPTITDLLSPCG